MSPDPQTLEDTWLGVKFEIGAQVGPLQLRRLEGGDWAAFALNSETTNRLRIGIGDRDKCIASGRRDQIDTLTREWLQSIRYPKAEGSGASYKGYARAPGVPASSMAIRRAAFPPFDDNLTSSPFKPAPADQLEQTVDDTIHRQGGGWSTFCRLGEWWVERVIGARRVSMSLSTTNADLAGSRFYHLQNEFRETALDELLLAAFALRIQWARERPKTIDVAEVKP